MGWFPEHKSIPKDSNVECIYDTFALHHDFNPEEMSRIKTDDLTFMIPYGTDSKDRHENMKAVLAWILLTTTAKIRMYWSMTDESYDLLMEKFSVVDGDDLRNEVMGLAKNKAVIPVGELSESGQQAFKGFFIYNTFKDWVSNHHQRYDRAAGLKYSDFVTRFNLTPPADSPTNVIQSPITTYLEKEADKRITVHFDYRESGETFHRMQYLNKMLSEVDTELVCNHDSDIIIPNYSLVSALARLRTFPDIDFVYPYGYRSRSQLRVLSTSVSQSALLNSIVSQDFSSLVHEGCSATTSQSYGASFFARTSAYKECGGENEMLLGWGPDDVERYVRFSVLGRKIARVHEGFVFHLEHPQTSTSGPGSKHDKENDNLWSLLQQFSPEDYAHYMHDMWAKDYGFNLKVLKPAKKGE